MLIRVAADRWQPPGPAGIAANSPTVTFVMRILDHHGPPTERNASDAPGRARLCRGDKGQCPAVSLAGYARDDDPPGWPTAPTPLRSLPRVGISHSFLTDWSDGTGLWHAGRTPGRTLTCGYGLGRTVRTLSIDLGSKGHNGAVQPHEEGCFNEDAATAAARSAFEGFLQLAADFVGRGVHRALHDFGGT